MCIPITRLEEIHEQCRAPKFGMQSETFEKAVEGVSASLGEIRTEAVTSDVLHLVLVGQRGDGALWVLERQLFVEEDEVGEATADLGGRFGE